jgi:hypothetical protein
MVKNWLDLNVYGVCLTLEEGIPTLTLRHEDDHDKAVKFFNIIKEHRFFELTETNDDRVAYHMPVEDLSQLPKLLKQAKVVKRDESDINQVYQTILNEKPTLVEGDQVDEIPDNQNNEVTDTTSIQENKPNLKEAAANKGDTEAKVKHEDVGRKVGGARKDLYSRAYIVKLTDDIKAVNDQEDVEPEEKERELLSQLTSLKNVNKKDIAWPKPNWEQLKEEGMTAHVASVIKYARDLVAAQPYITGRLSNLNSVLEQHRAYAEIVSGLRDTFMKLRTDDDIKEFREKLNEAHKNRANTQSLEHLLVGDISPDSTMHLNVIYKKRSSFSSFSGYLENVPHQAFDIIVREATIKSYNSRKQEYTWDYVQPKRRNKEAVDRSDQPVKPSPHLEHISRKGPDYRLGRDVTGEELMETFGFSGIEYGNWLPNKERQEVLNFAYDSFKDLASVTGLKDKDLSFDGRLAIAFGARGRSKASAHYEPGHLVINLTRMNGGGFLAHEWGHALDHYLHDRINKKHSTTLLTETIHMMHNQVETAMSEKELRHIATRHASQLSEDDELPKYSRYAEVTIHDIMSKAMNDMKRVNKTNDEVVAGANTSIKSYSDHASSWLISAERRVFRRHNSTNYEYDTERVANIKSEVMAFLTEKSAQGHQVSPSALIEHLQSIDLINLRKSGAGVTQKLLKMERQQIELSIANVFDAVTKKIKIAGGYEHQETKASSYAINGSKLDKGKSTKAYWGTNVELFARAFESWVMDKLDDRERENTYLSGVAYEGKYANPELYTADPYPAGDERQAINENFNELFKQINMANKYQDILREEIALNAEQMSNGEHKLVAGR